MEFCQQLYCNKCHFIASLGDVQNSQNCVLGLFKKLQSRRTFRLIRKFPSFSIQGRHGSSWFFLLHCGFDPYHLSHWFGFSSEDSDPAFPDKTRSLAQAIIMLHNLASLCVSTSVSWCCHVHVPQQ